MKAARSCILFASIFIFVLFVNSAILSMDMIYPEQPLLYSANQSIHSLTDLLGIYTHPQMLNIFSIPFFRPSGHFLMYQLVEPFLGWHNMQGLVVINLLFLALTGWVMVKLYELLFPGFVAGGYIAFAIYLMHPALMLSRLIVLHFEFAYVFFALLSLYWMARYCREQAVHRGYLVLALLSYVLAVTFKEPAIVMGPLLALYFCLFQQRPYQERSNAVSYQRKLVSRLFYKENWQLLLLLTILSISLALYLTLAWPTMEHPLRPAITNSEKLAAAKALFENLLGIATGMSTRANLAHSKLVWREMVTTPVAKLILWSGFISMLLCFTQLRNHKKSCLFLVAAALFCLVLPINWAMGLPWHLSMTIAFLSLLFGFSYDYLTSSRGLSAGPRRRNLGLLLALAIGLTTISVNQANIHYLQSQVGFSMRLIHNAVFHPPLIQDKLNAESVVLVEDSFLHDGYALGNGGYPLFLMDINYEGLEQVQDYSFFKYQPTYNGYLFKWAYLKPGLQEEIFPFSVDRMKDVPDSVIHDWLQHINNIYCLGYDQAGNWQDKTMEFKKNLLQQKNIRYLQVHPYEPLAATNVHGRILYTKSLSYPDYQICRYECDQNVQCKGFTYEEAKYHYHSSIKCQFYDAVSSKDQQFCATCVGFLKGSSSAINSISCRK